MATNHPASRVKFQPAELDVVGLAEAKLDAPKREVVLEALKPGMGNKRDKRLYTAKAAESLVPLLLARPKIFATPHPTPGQAIQPNRLQDWVATVTEAAVVDGRAVVRVKIHEDWLWKRAEEAPQQLALSIEGVGAGRQDIFEGAPVFLIERIEALNAMKFVDYPGNTTMGALLVEAETTSEDTAMDFAKLTIALLKEHRADLVAELVKESVAAALAEAETNHAAELAEAKAKAAGADPAAIQAAVKAAVEEAHKAFNSSMDEMRARLEEAEKRADGLEVREKLNSKKALIERKLAESKLPAEAITERFKARLNGLTEKKAKDDKGADVVITVEAQVDAEIHEQRKLITESYGVPRTGGAPAGGPAAAGDVPVTEDEKQVVFNRRMLGYGPTLAEYRKQKADEAAKKAGAAA